jgi:acyl-coenzyme A synthetase/AMP-(fatty) acid ligase
VIHTSGSTGRPKGVVIPRGAMAAFVDHECTALALRPTDRMVAVTTISFDIAVLELFVPLVCGAAVAVADRATVRDPDLLADLVRRVRCTHLQATPSLWRPLLDAHPEVFGQVTALVGGEALPGDLAATMARSCRSVINVYGPTEVTVWATSAAVDPAAIPVGASAPIGLPFTDVGTLVLDAALRPVPDGVPGELYLAGAQLARGYHDRPGLTAGRFVAHPGGRPGERMYRTGDVVRRDGSGRLRFLRRADDQVKVNGFRIELGEVEAGLRAVDGVLASAAVVRPDAAGGARLLGYVVPVPDRTLDGPAVRQAWAAVAPAQLVPRHVLVLDALPLTLNGKVDRNALPEPEVTVSAERRGPSGAAEEILCAAVADTLRLAAVSPEDGFFELGGDSISSIRLVASCRTAGLTITPGLVFLHTRLADLAAAGTLTVAPTVVSRTTRSTRRTRVRIGADDLSSIERLLESRQ